MIPCESGNFFSLFLCTSQNGFFKKDTVNDAEYNEWKDLMRDGLNATVALCAVKSSNDILAAVTSEQQLVIEGSEERPWSGMTSFSLSRPGSMLEDYSGMFGLDSEYGALGSLTYIAGEHPGERVGENIWIDEQNGETEYERISAYGEAVEVQLNRLDGGKCMAEAAVQGQGGTDIGINHYHYIDQPSSVVEQHKSKSEPGDRLAKSGRHGDRNSDTSYELSAGARSGARTHQNGEGDSEDVGGSRENEYYTLSPGVTVLNSRENEYRTVSTPDIADSVLDRHEYGTLCTPDGKALGSHEHEYYVLSTPDGTVRDPKEHEYYVLCTPDVTPCGSPENGCHILSPYATATDSHQSSSSRQNTSGQSGCHSSPTDVDV